MNTILKRSGSSSVEFALMISLLTGIGLLIMGLMTDHGNNAIGAGANSAITAIKKD